MAKITQDQLSTLWPPEDWGTLINDERPDALIERLNYAYSKLLKSPRQNIYPIRNDDWQEAYEQGLSVLRAIFRKTKTLDDLTKINERFCTRLGLDYENIKNTVIHKAYVYWAITDIPIESIKDKLVQDAIDLSGSLPINKVTSIKQTSVQDNQNTPPKVEQKPIDKATSTQTTKEPIKNDQDDTIIPPSMLEIPAKNTQTQSHAPINPIKEYVTTPIAKNEVTRAKRFGPEMPNNVTANQIRLEFNFKMVSVAAEVKDKQLLLNTAYAAFCDLSDAIEIPRKWVGMQSITLELGLQSVTESKSFLMNFDGTADAGSLAHQWMLMLDNRVADTINAKMRIYERFVSM